MCRSSSRIRRISKVASPQKYRRKGITSSRRQEPEGRSAVFHSSSILGTERPFLVYFYDSRDRPPAKSSTFPTAASNKTIEGKEGCPSRYEFPLLPRSCPCGSNFRTLHRKIAESLPVCLTFQQCVSAKDDKVSTSLQRKSASAQSFRPAYVLPSSSSIQTQPQRCVYETHALTVLVRTLMCETHGLTLSVSQERV